MGSQESVYRYPSHHLTCGKIEAEAVYLNGLSNGTFTIYYGSGDKLAEPNYLNGDVDEEGATCWNTRGKINDL